MYRSSNYPTSPEEVEAFVATQSHGTLIAITAEGFPEASLLPFVFDSGVIELHAVRADPTFRALQENPRVAFLVADFLAFTPHHWRHPDDAGLGTLHFKAVRYQGIASWSTDPEAVAGALSRLLAHHEPDAVYDPVTADSPRYAARLAMLAAIRIRITGIDAKFKVGPPGAEHKRAVVAGLRARGWPNDLRAAAEIEARLAAGG